MFLTFLQQLFLMVLLAFPHPLTATLVATNETILAPRTLVAVQGEQWVPSGSFGLIFAGEWEVGGYTVTLGGKPCRITSLDAGSLQFVVPDDAPLSIQTISIQGPTMYRELTVQVDAFHPTLYKQSPAGETNPECCVIAMGHQGFAPFPYIGTPLPVGLTSSNYIAIHGTGFVGIGNTPAVVILRKGDEEHIIDDANAYQAPAMPGREYITYFARPCLDGEYSVEVRVGAFISSLGVIRFTSNCMIPVLPVAPVRPLRVRPV